MQRENGKIQKMYNSIYIYPCPDSLVRATPGTTLAKMNNSSEIVINIMVRFSNLIKDEEPDFVDIVISHEQAKFLKSALEVAIKSNVDDGLEKQ